MTEKKRGRGRPPKNGKGAMSSAERQKQYRERLRQARKPVTAMPEKVNAPKWSPFTAVNNGDVLREARARAAKEADAATNPARRMAWEARYEVAHALLSAGEWVDAVVAGENGEQRMMTLITGGAIERLEERFQELDAHLSEREAAVPVQSSSLPDDETRMLIRNILGSEDAAEAGEALKLMRRQLIATSLLVERVEQAMKSLNAEMHSFAIGGKAMDRKTRRTVYSEICAINDSARLARKALMEVPTIPPAWARGEKDWT